MGVVKNDFLRVLWAVKFITKFLGKLQVVPCLTVGAGAQPRGPGPSHETAPRWPQSPAGSLREQPPRQCKTRIVGDVCRGPL